MQRALARAYQRLKNAHPRAPRTPAGRAKEILCDVMLAGAAIGFVAGVGLVVASPIGGFHLARLVAGLALLALGPLLLLVWERLAWAPFARRLAQMD